MSPSSIIGGVNFDYFMKMVPPYICLLKSYAYFSFQLVNL